MSRKLAIVPAYNERACVGRVVEELRQHAPDFDVLVVDDGSTDDTADVARDAGAQVIRHPFNLGIGGAVQSGYQYADANGYALAVQVDGDGQHDAREIERLLEHHERDPSVDLIVGSRFLPGGDGDGDRSSVSRRIGIRLLARVLSTIVRQPVTDPTSGFRLAGPRGIRLFARDYPHDYPEVEAVLLIHGHRLTCVEIPVKMRPRAAGVSSINSTRSAYYMVKVLLAVFVGLFRSRTTITPGDEAPVAAEQTL